MGEILGRERRNLVGKIRNERERTGEKKKEIRCENWEQNV